MTTDSRSVAPLGSTAAAATATGREILQQPQVWRQVAADLVGRRDAVRDFLAPLLATPELRVVLTGAGTSAFAGQLLAPALARRLARRVDAVASTDIVSNPGEVFAEDVPTLLVSFARSGDSPESVAATALADQCLRSVHHLIVTCNADGRLSREHSAAGRSLVLLMPPASNDEGFAMTSSFTSMVLAAWLALAPDEATETVERLAAAGEAVLRDRAEAVAELAARGYQRIVYLGSGPLAALARESALKVLELTAGTVVSYFDSSLGFRHGPKSVVDGRTLTIVYLSNDAYTRRYDEDIAAELQRLTGVEDVVVVGAQDGERVGPGHLWAVPGVADVPDVLVSLPFVLVAQMLALHTSLAHGLTPDNPFPSGEVNRVVQGVTVHPYRAGR